MSQSSIPSVLPETLNQLVAAFDASFASRLRALDGARNLADAVAYAALAPGKRMRPLLVLLSAQAVGGSAASAMHAASALELIHCFSLVHDDLPAMDDDDLRRGRPTLHIHTNEAMAILAGDLMLSLAFEWLAEEHEACQASASELVRTMSRATSSMINGQVLDTFRDFDDATPDEERLEQIHHQKTGALIVAACRLGGLCGGAEPESLAQLEIYGAAIGYMFQIIDDLIDVTQSTEHVGKTTGKDHEAGKLTHPGIHGIEKSRAEVERLMVRAGDAVSALGPNAEPLRQLAGYLSRRSR